MNLLQSIRTSGKKGKELVSSVAGLIASEKPSAEDYSRAFKEGKDAERGVCVEALEFVTQTNPGAAGPYLAIVIERLSDRAPRVSWEAARVIANVASAFPVEAEAAIPGLLQNTQDEGTVVRWSAAFALAEIAMYVPSRRADLLQEMKALSEKEENNGVKNIYLKALKKLKARF